MKNLPTEVLTIDPLRLDRECVEQPQRYFAAAEELARKRSAMEEAKTGIDLASADVDQKIRARPDKYGLDKVTEAAVAKIVQGSEEVDDARKAFASARYEYDLAQALVIALDHKKSMLGHLVSLHGQNYFSAVQPETRPGREAMDEIRDRAVAARTAEATKRSREARPLGRRK